MINVKEAIWKRVVSKLRYFRNECRKKDKIIKAYEEQMELFK